MMDVDLVRDLIFKRVDALFQYIVIKIRGPESCQGVLTAKLLSIANDLPCEGVLCRSQADFISTQSYLGNHGVKSDEGYYQMRYR